MQNGSSKFNNRSGSRMVAKFLQESILIAFDFKYGIYCSPVEIYLPF